MAKRGRKKIVRIPMWYVYEKDDDCLYAFHKEKKAMDKAGERIAELYEKGDYNEGDNPILVFEVVQVIKPEIVRSVKTSGTTATSSEINAVVGNYEEEW